MVENAARPPAPSGSQHPRRGWLFCHSPVENTLSGVWRPPDASPTTRRAVGSAPRPGGGNSNGLLAPRTLAGVGQASQDGLGECRRGTLGDGRGTGAMGRLEGNTTVAALRYQD